MTVVRPSRSINYIKSYKFYRVIIPRRNDTRKKAPRILEEENSKVDDLTKSFSDDKSEIGEPLEVRDDLCNPFWADDKDIGNGEIDYLSGVEIQFWQGLIEKYLYPLDADAQKQVRLY